MSLDQLTGREVEVAKLLFRGLRPKQIAGELKISYNTVKQHCSWVYKKLGVKGQAQMLAFYGIGDIAA